MASFRSMIEIEFVQMLVDLNSPTNVEQVIDYWIRIRSGVQIIDINRLRHIGVPEISLKLQLERPR